MNHLKRTSCLALGALYVLVACSPAEMARPTNANTIAGAWVLSIKMDYPYNVLQGERAVPLGFDFSLVDSVEIFCDPRKGERYTTYQLVGDTLVIHRTDSTDWFRYRHQVKQDTLLLYRGNDTVTYRRVDMSDFKPVPIDRIYLSAASWSWIVGLSFDMDGSMEVSSNGTNSDKYNPYLINKVYKLNHSPVPFERISRSMQKLHHIAQSKPGRQLYDSADISCFDGAQYSILWESDSLRERTYSTCGLDFEFFKYGDYLIRKVELDGERSPLKMVTYDSIVDSPIFYCGRLLDSANHKKSYTISEQLYIARHIRLGARLSGKIGPLPTTLLNYCGSERYAAVLRTDGRKFQVVAGKKTYYIDAGKNLLSTLGAIKGDRTR